MENPLSLTCTLTQPEIVARAPQWESLRSLALDIRRIDQGAAMLLPVSLADAVSELIEKESTCCGFLSLSLRTTPRGLLLEVESSAYAGVPLILAMAGLDDRASRP